MASKRTFAAAASAIALLLASACGDGSSDEDGESTTDAPIKIFQYAEYQTPAFSLPFMKTSAEAAVSEINDKGGVAGRKLELITCNDGFDPNTSIKCGQAAIQDKDVVSLVGSHTSFGDQLNPLFEAAGLANVGIAPVTASDTNSPVAFPIYAGSPLFLTMPVVAKEYADATKIGAMHISSGTVDTLNGYFEVGASQADVEIAKSVEIPADATDHTQYVTQLESAGAEAVVSTMGLTNNLALWKAIESSGSSMKTIMSTSTVSADLIEQAGGAAEGNYVISGPPATTPDNPTGKAYSESMAKYQPDEKTLNGLGLDAWLSVQLFAMVAEEIDGPITRESTLEAFNKVHDLDFYWLDSLSYDEPGPVKEHPRVTNWNVFVFEIKDGVFVDRGSFNPFEA